MKTVSPVIATIIIVTIALAISIVVSIWIAETTEELSKTRKTPAIDITAAYVSMVNYTTSTRTYWEITLIIRNKGTGDTYIDTIYVDNEPLDKTDYGKPVGIETKTWISNASDKPPAPIKHGKTTAIYIYLDKNLYKPGQRITITIHTTTGKQYSVEVPLP